MHGYSGEIRRVTLIVTFLRVLVTLLISTHQPPSGLDCRLRSKGFHKGVLGGFVGFRVEGLGFRI